MSLKKESYDNVIFSVILLIQEVQIKGAKIAVIEQLRKIDKIQDLLALCASYILTMYNEEPYEFAFFDDDEFDCVYDAVERYCCECREKGRRKAFEELREYIISFMVPETTIEKCFAIVKYIDELVEVEITGKLLGGNQIIKYSSINEQYKDCIRIIPKMKGTFLDRGNLQFKSINDDSYSLFRDRRECACSLLDKETLNYMIWDKEHIKKYPMWIYRFDEKNPIAKHFYGRKQIIFGIVPFTNKSLDNLLEVKYEKKGFYIEQMYEKAEEELKQRYQNVCLRCESEDIDFLVFPEMLMTEKIIFSTKRKEKMQSPRIIVNGSIWKDFMNKAVITDGSGESIFTYYKKEPFKFQKGHTEYKECLDHNKNGEYSIMEIEGLGRIGVGICKDLISEDVKLFHKHIGTDILIVPAYTKSMDLQASAEEMSQEYNCVVVVANACSALDETKRSSANRRIGFITLPAKCNTDRSKIILRYTQNNCAEECECKCSGKKVLIDFYNTKVYDDKISYEVKEETF